MVEINEPSRNDVFAIAMKMEETGHDFYHALAAAVGDPEVSKFCEQCAVEEARHLGEFRRMRRDNTAPSPDAQAMGDLAKRMIQPDPSEVQRVAMGGDIREALTMAIRMEEHAIFFYRQLAELYPMQEQALHKVAAEEEKHLQSFRELLVAVLNRK